MEAPRSKEHKLALESLLDERKGALLHIYINTHIVPTLEGRDDYPSSPAYKNKIHDS